LTAISPIDRVKQRLHAVLSGWNSNTSYPDMRRQWDALFRERQRRADSEPVRAGGVDATWITADEARSDRVLMYLHGGGYVMGSVASHWDLIAALSSACGCRALGVDYRLAPEHVYPAAVEDATSAYRWLLAQGFAPGAIAIAGDSAGAGLAATLLLALRRASVPMPSSVGLMSPWVDFEAVGESFVTRKHADPMVRRRLILENARIYLSGNLDPQDPVAAPMHADLSGLPPLMIQVGEHETLLDDARGYAERARCAGVEVELEVWDGMFHVFQLFASELESGRRAIDSMGDFIQRHFQDSHGIQGPK
jgi:epsilon-lactone hydrolase